MAGGMAPGSGAATDRAEFLGLTLRLQVGSQQMPRSRAQSLPLPFAVLLGGAPVRHQVSRPSIDSFRAIDSPSCVSSRTTGRNARRLALTSASCRIEPRLAALEHELVEHDKADDRPLLLRQRVVAAEVAGVFLAGNPLTRSWRLGAQPRDVVERATRAGTSASVANLSPTSRLRPGFARRGSSLSGAPRRGVSWRRASQTRVRAREPSRAAGLTWAQADVTG